MVNTLDSIKQQLNTFWGDLEKTRRRNLLIIIGLIIFAIILFSFLLSRKDYTVLYSGLTDKESAEVYARLKEINAQPKISGTSTILVPKDKEAELRMQMTLEGYPKSGFNYDIYFEGGSFGQTNDEIQRRWIIQLQERLGQSIRFLEGVEEAVVTIAMPKSDSFVLKENEIPVTASVIILPKRGHEISGQQAKSIEQLVATSIPGLDKDNISIIDNKMNVLNKGATEDSHTVANQFVMQQQLEERIKKEIQDLLEPVFGFQRVKAAVNVRLNFDKRTKESITFEPVLDDSGIIISQELLKERISSSSNSGIAGESSNTTQYPEDHSGGNSDSQTEHKKINYEVNEIKEKIEEEQGKVDRLSIAVVIDNEKLDQQTIDGVRELVATAMGTDLDRVAVQNWKFNTDMQKDLIDALRPPTKSSPWLNGGTIAIILLSIILILILMVRYNKNKRLETEWIMDEGMQEGLEFPEEAIPDIEVGEQSKIKKQLDAFTEEQPEEIAQLLRNWLGED